MIKREMYLSRLRDFYESSLIKVILGVRRSGKSEILRQIRDELLEKNINPDHLIYMNFESMEYADCLTAESLHQKIKKIVVDEEKYYFLFDEIQTVKDFEKAINSFKATLNCSIFLTGSNAQLLSGKLATLLTGRYISIKIMPFVYSEMIQLYQASNKKVNESTFMDYLKWGGMPQRFEFSNEQSLQTYLDDLINSIIFKDILNDKMSDKELTKRIIKYLFENTAKIFSDKTVYNQLKENKVEVGTKKVYDSIARIIDSMTISKCSRYDIQGKEVLSLYEKYYVVDLGLRRALHLNNIPNYGASVETILYNEFIARGYSVHVGKTYRGEVDFVVINGDKRVYVQCSYKMNDESTLEREFGAFANISDAYPKYVMSMDEEDYSREGIEHIRLIDYLLHKKDIDL